MWMKKKMDFETLSLVLRIQHILHISRIPFIVVVMLHSNCIAPTRKVSTTKTTVGS